MERVAENKKGTLYKIGGIGQVLQWRADVRAPVTGLQYKDIKQIPIGPAEIIIYHGQVDGKIQQDRELVAEGKNLGRANETLPWEQALSQVESRYNKQADNGYRETIADAHEAAASCTKPMLAHKLVDKAHKLVVGRTYGSQAKLDGMRCIAHWKGDEVELLSRIGKVIESVPHINAELRAFLPKGEVWDGELYVHGMEFEKNQSINKRKAKNLHPEYASMQFHIFDEISDDHYPERHGTIEGLLWHRKTDKILHVVPYTEITYANEDQLVDLAEAYEGRGYEGLILRGLYCGYEHKRSIQLIKVKKFFDAEFKIVGTEAGKASTDQEGLLIKFEIEYTKKDGTGVDTCDATLMGTEHLRREMLTRRSQYLGQWCTIKYQELSKYGAPRFAKVKAIREMEDLCPVY